MSSLSLSSLSSPPQRLRSQGVNEMLRVPFQDSAACSKAGATPYSTPFKSRNQSLVCPNLNHAQTKTTRKLKQLLNKQWYFFNVSPLYNMNYSEASFKRYARRLKEKLMSKLPDESGSEYEVSYSTFPNLQYKSTDHKAIEVKVMKITDNENRSMAYNAILLSWGADGNIQPDNATFLPILLCQGLKSVVKTVHLEFQLIHDCFVSRFNIDDAELKRLCTSILNSSCYGDNSIIKLRYQMPHKLQTGALDISLPINILTQLWECARSSPQQWSDSDVVTFWNELHAHTQRSFGIDLNHFILVKATLPDIALTPDVVSTKDKNQMHSVLWCLMNLNSSLSSVTPHLYQTVLVEW